MAKRKLTPPSQHEHDSMNASVAFVPSSSSHFLDLPEVLLYYVLSFVAGPTHRCHVVCHQLAPLSSSARDMLLRHSPIIWDAILEGDYGVHNDHHGKNRRASKRLKRELLQRVRDAHKMILDNTQIAYYYLEELCQCGTKQRLTSKRLCQILDEYGPHLRLNDRTKTGGTFLVECCRARSVRETTILHCVKELIENRDAQVDVTSHESAQSTLTALCVAAARGLPTVVSYLLSQCGASAHIRCTGRFRLHTNSRKSVKCTNSTPLEFSKAMHEAELQYGAAEEDLSSLNKCIRYLSRVAGPSGNSSTKGGHALVSMAHP